MRVWLVAVPAPKASENKFSFQILTPSGLDETEVAHVILVRRSQDWEFVCEISGAGNEASFVQDAQYSGNNVRDFPVWWSYFRCGGATSGVAALHPVWRRYFRFLLRWGALDAGLAGRNAGSTSRGAVRRRARVLRLGVEQRRRQVAGVRRVLLPPTARGPRARPRPRRAAAAAIRPRPTQRAHRYVVRYGCRTHWTFCFLLQQSVRVCERCACITQNTPT